MKTDVYQIVTDRIIAKLEAGTIPWKHFASAPLSQSMNLVTKRPYHGINYLLLTNSRFSSPNWLSYKQAQELGGYIRKGEKAEIVVFWHRFGSKPYVQEELVAEMGAGFLCAETGMFQAVEENTAAYVASWLAKLANDKKLVVYAAGKAQKAVDYIRASAETADAEEAK